MRGSLPGRLAGVVAALAVASAYIVTSSLAHEVSGVPKSPAHAAPAHAAIPKGHQRNRPLIVLKFKHGRATSLTGTAVPLAATIKPRKRSRNAVQAVRCAVKFSDLTQSAGMRATANWFARIGCTRPMLLFGQADLQQTTRVVDGRGRRYRRMTRSASSGRDGTVIDSAHPSLYIGYRLNVYFPNRTSSGEISVYPAHGEVLNGASRCGKATFGRHHLGVHCVLYTNRTSSTTPSGPAVRHIVWMIMENNAYDQIIGDTKDAPYINSLSEKFGSATQMFAEGHPSLPNYVAMTSGSTQGITDDSGPSSHPLDVPNVFRQLSGGRSRSLVESIPSNCDRSDSTTYAVRHNPEAYYTNLGTDCANLDVPFGSIPDLSAQFTLIVPNECHDMHSNSCSGPSNLIAQGDQFLQSYVPQLLHSKQYMAGDTVIFITWDEDSGSNGNHIPTLILDPFGAHTTAACQRTHYTHYSMLRYVEDTFGVSRIGGAASANSMRGCFGLP